jgi:hypothetical protein
LQTTNVIESVLSTAENAAGNIKRWGNGWIVLRWMAQGGCFGREEIQENKGL